MRFVIILLALYNFALSQEITIRNKPAMAFDSARKRLVVFGGMYEVPAAERRPRVNPVRGDTWKWDGEKWEQVATDGPSARCVNAMVYDAKRKKIVMFGGEDTNLNSLGDTWEWDG